MSQGQPEFPRLPRVHAELEPQSFIPTAGQTQRSDPGVTYGHFDRHQDGAASRRRGLQPVQRGAGGVGVIHGGRRTRGKRRSSGALRHSPPSPSVTSHSTADSLSTSVTFLSLHNHTSHLITKQSTRPISFSELRSYQPGRYPVSLQLLLEHGYYVHVALKMCHYKTH